MARGSQIALGRYGSNRPFVSIWTRSLDIDNWLPAGLIVSGIALRLAWMATADTRSQMIGEANNVAISFAQFGTFADAFRPGQGPTAHVMPIMPIIAGSVYRVLGVQTPSANVVLTLIALAFLTLTWVALYRVMELAGMPRFARCAGLALVTLVPINVAIETVEFRVWEGGLAVALGATLLWNVLWLDTRKLVTTRQFIGVGLHAAITLFVSPGRGLAAFACGGLLMVRRSAPARWLPIASGVIIVTVVVLAPWTLRNLEVFHRPIVLRDNFGLEIAQAFYPGAEQPGDPRVKFIARHREIHPYQPVGNAAMIAAGGEVPYYDTLGLQAKAWIMTHPRPALGIAMGHLRDLLLPPAWYWSQFGRTGNATSAKLAMNWVISVFGLAGLAYGWFRGQSRYTYLTAMILLPLLPYLAVEPTLRYRYLIVNLLSFIAAGTIADVSERILRRRSTLPGQGLTAGDSSFVSASPVDLGARAVTGRLKIAL